MLGYWSETDLEKLWTLHPLINRKTTCTWQKVSVGRLLRVTEWNKYSQKLKYPPDFHIIIQRRAPNIWRSFPAWVRPRLSDPHVGNSGFPLKTSRFPAQVEITLMTSSQLFLIRLYKPPSRSSEDFIRQSSTVRWAELSSTGACLAHICSNPLFLDGLLIRWSSTAQVQTEPGLWFFVGFAQIWLHPSFPLLYVPVPAAIIASMSLSCGAGHADDVSKRWKGEEEQLGGVIILAVQSLILSAESPARWWHSYGARCLYE